MKAPFAVLLVVLAAASAVSNLRAQVTGATVVGKVTDATGVPVSNALVAVRRPDTGTSNRGQDERGGRLHGSEPGSGHL